MGKGRIWTGPLVSAGNGHLSCIHSCRSEDKGSLPAGYAAFVQLGQELEHIGNYLKLQKIRYPNAFSYEVICPASLEIIPIPPFLIEGFVSNAIKHGRTPGEHMKILVEAREIRSFRVQLRIADTGEGFPDEVLEDIESFLETGRYSEEMGIGIRNSIERLRLIYGKRAVIRFYNQEPRGAVAEIELCINAAGEEAEEENENTRTDRR